MGEQSAGISIRRGKAMVDIFCTHCEHSHLEPQGRLFHPLEPCGERRAFPFPQGFNAIGNLDSGHLLYIHSGLHTLGASFTPYRPQLTWWFVGQQAGGRAAFFIC